MPSSVRIVEVGPRDGLQNEAKIVPTEKKAEFVRLLAAAGLRDIEVASFVHPKWVPQLADAPELVQRLEPNPKIRYSALVPNMKGLERAIETGIRRIAVFTAASETFNRKNINMGIQESIDVFKPVVERALKEGISVRGYVSTCFVCPYEGAIGKEKVADVVSARLGASPAALADSLQLAERMHDATVKRGRELRSALPVPVVPVPLQTARAGLATARAVADVLAEATA